MKGSKVLRPVFAQFDSVLKRYGNYIYGAVEVPREEKRALGVVSAFLDFYAWERGWTPLKAARQAKKSDFLLVIDEINRADLGRVLGEAIYLFGRAGSSAPFPCEGRTRGRWPAAWWCAPGSAGKGSARFSST